MVYLAKALALLLLLAVGYLLGSFTSWSFDPYDWGTPTRWLIGASVLLLCALELDSSDAEEE